MRYLEITIAAVGTMAFFAHGTNELCAQEPTVEDVVQMWSERQAATTTAEFHWAETVTGRQSLPSGDERDVSREKLDCTFWLSDGSNMRSESIAVKSPVEPGVSLTRTGLAVSTYNGKRNAYYTAAADPDDHHRGIEFSAENYDEIVNYHLRVIILSYRPLLVVQSLFSSRESRIVRHEAKLSIVDRNVTLDGTPCLVIESSSVSPSPVVNRYWVDVTRGGLILKYAESVSGRPTGEVTISYRVDTENGWVPASWHGRFLNDSINASVTKFNLNKPIVTGLFEIEYPSGTLVFDQDQSKQWRILSDGTKELVILQKAEK